MHSTGMVSLFDARGGSPSSAASTTEQIRGPKALAVVSSVVSSNLGAHAGFRAD